MTEGSGVTADLVAVEAAVAEAVASAAPLVTATVAVRALGMGAVVA